MIRTAEELYQAAKTFALLTGLKTDKEIKETEERYERLKVQDMDQEINKQKRPSLTKDDRF